MENKKRLTDKEYKFIFSQVPRFCLDFIIVKDGKVLLAKREINPCKGFWCLPGGMVRYQETINQASERILKNELGLKPKSKKVIGYIEFPNEINKDGVPVHSVSLVFLTVLKDGEIKGSNQAYEIEFFKKLPQKTNFEQGQFLIKNHFLIR